MIGRLPWLILLTALSLVILAYPLRLKDEWRLPLTDAWRRGAEGSVWARLAIAELEPMIEWFHSALVLKGALGAVALLAFVAVSLALGQMARLAGAGGADRAPRPPGNAASPPWAFGFWLGFVLWAALSAFWTPARSIGLAGAPWVLVYGLAGYFLFRRGITEGEGRELAGLMILLGAIVAVISALESTQAFGGFVFDFLPRWSDPRNIYGSLIGHNTDLSSYLMATTFPAIAWAVLTRRPLLRGLLLGYLALTAYVVVVGQSRAIWVLLPPLTLAFLVVVARRRPSRLTRALAPAALAVGVLAIGTQAVRAPWNPFFVADPPVTERLKALSPAGLLRESRLRLLVVSLPLIAERPIAGWGLNAFRSIYPTAQAEYFALHPNSRLNITIHRSNLAHNDYLQILIEQGGVGLALFLAALAEIGRRGRRAAQGLSEPGRLMHTAFGFSALGFGLHTLSHFLLHVPQVALPWIVCLAAYGSARPERIAEAGATAGLGQILRLERGSRAFRPAHVARLTLAWMMILLIPLPALPFLQLYQADVDYSRARAYLEALRSPEVPMSPAARAGLMDATFFHLERGLRLMPVHDEMRYLLAEAYYLRADDRARAAQRHGGGQAAAGPGAATLLNEALAQLEITRRTLAYHDTFYLMARCYGALVNLDPDNEAYRTAYLRSLETTLLYAPTHPSAMYLLDRWLSFQPDPDLGRIVNLRRKLRAHWPHYFDQWYTSRAYEALKARDFEAAAAAAENLLEVDGQNPEFLNLALEAYVWSGRPEARPRARQLIDALEGGHRGPSSLAVPPPTFAGAYRALLEEDWPGLLAWLAPNRMDTPRRRAFFCTLETLARGRLGREAMPTRYPRPRGLDPAAWEALLAEEQAYLAARLLGDRASAREAFERRRAIVEPPPEATFWVEYALWAERVGEPEAAREAWEAVARLAPAHPMLARRSALGAVDFPPAGDESVGR